MSFSRHFLLGVVLSFEINHKCVFRAWITAVKIVDFFALKHLDILNYSMKEISRKYFGPNTNNCFVRKGKLDNALHAIKHAPTRNRYLDPEAVVSMRRT